MCGRLGIYLGLVLCFALNGCKSGRPRAEFVLEPPPVVPSVVLVSDPGGKPPHDDSGAAHDQSHAEPEHSRGEPNDSSDGSTEAVSGEGAEVVVGAITVRAALSHSLYGQSLPKRLIFMVAMNGASEKPSQRRPLNLALVFDRSGSMAQEQKFMHAMQAASMVVENLSDRDVISLIAFNETAVVLSPAGRAVNKDFLRYRLGQFGPDGQTNLSAGLLEAFAQIESQSALGQSKRVVVLTDGLANRGITDPEKLRQLVAAARARGIGLSTLGCGTEFSQELLTELAAAGGGRYTYVKSGEQIPAAIAAELDGLLDVVAQNVKLEIQAASGGAITRVYGRLIGDPMPAYRVELGDIRDGEESLFLVEIAPDRFADGATVGVDVTLTFDDPETSMRAQRQTHYQAAFSKDLERVRRSVDDGVLMYANIFDAMEKAEEAIQGLDLERFQEASVRFDQYYDVARRHAIAMRDQQLLNQTYLLQHFMAELSATAETASMHDHRTARQRIKKDVDYRHYLLEHHRRQQGP